MPKPPAHSPETIERVREMYRAGAPVREICAATGVSVGSLYHHLDGLSLPGLVPPRLPRRRLVEGRAEKLPPSGARRRLAARLWRVAERQARRIEFALTWSHQNADQRGRDLAALRELAKILRDLAVVDESAPRARRRACTCGGEAGPVEQETALAVEGRAIYLRRERRG